MAMPGHAKSRNGCPGVQVEDASGPPDCYDMAGPDASAAWSQRDGVSCLSQKD